ncbi:MAG: hypothetical protein ACLR6I_12935 [Waltera sp.]
MKKAVAMGVSNNDDDLIGGVLETLRVRQRRRRAAQLRQKIQGVAKT